MEVNTLNYAIEGVRSMKYEDRLKTGNGDQWYFSQNL